jgi:hypothetical protein
MDVVPLLRECLMILEIIVNPFHSEPVLEVKSVSAITPPEFVGSLVISPAVVCFWKKPEP